MIYKWVCRGGCSWKPWAPLVFRESTIKTSRQALKTGMEYNCRIYGVLFVEMDDTLYLNGIVYYNSLILCSKIHHTIPEDSWTAMMPTMTSFLKKTYLVYLFGNAKAFGVQYSDSFDVLYITTELQNEDGKRLKREQEASRFYSSPRSWCMCAGVVTTYNTTPNTGATIPEWPSTHNTIGGLKIMLVSCLPE